MFLVGMTYKTKYGRLVKIVKSKYAGSLYACVQGDDGIWRYDRDGDVGRVTGSNHNMSHPNNLMPS